MVRRYTRQFQQTPAVEQIDHTGSVGSRVIKGKLALRPEIPLAKAHHRLDHVQRRGIGRRVGPPGLSHDHLHLGEAAQNHVARLEVVRRLPDGGSRHRNRHIHHGPFVERLEEFARQRLNLAVGNQ